MKPILFSTPMVRAILDGRKTQTRRDVKKVVKDCSKDHELFMNADWKNEPIALVSDYKNPLDWYCKYCGNGHGLLKAKYQPGDILYVRETWAHNLDASPFDSEQYIYKASVAYPEEFVWAPSIHMPKEAARIFLKVTNVRCERLQDISERDAILEGSIPHGSSTLGIRDGAFGFFRDLWQSIYGNWESNPWVWVYEFERIEKP